MNVLFIDMTDNKEIRVGVGINGKKFLQKRKVDFRKSQAVLPTIDVLLKKHNLKIENIDEIKVNTGPGSFTGIRVGLSIANALGFVLKIPVNGKNVIIS